MPLAAEKYLIKRASEMATTEYPVPIMEHPLCLQLIEELLQTHAGVRSSLFDRTLQLEQRLHVQCYIQGMNYLMLSRLQLFSYRSFQSKSALRLLQYIDRMPVDKFDVTLKPVTKITQPMIDQQCLLLINDPQASVETAKYHLVGANVTSTSTQPSLISARTTPPRLQLETSPLPNSTIVFGSCDHNGGVISSEDGIKLTVPEGAIKDGELVTFHIATSLYGPFVLPSKCQTNLASPYYWIGVSGSYHFHKPVQVEFEHFGACDPSHYQLLCCEDDNESCTMRPVDYELSFEERDNVSLCTFYSCHFCSYCLYHGCKDPMINRIFSLFLKSPDLWNFSVEIWFSFLISHCIKRNQELYTKRGMILDQKCSHIFEAPSDINSTSYFTLNYDKEINGWSINHFRSTMIKTKEVNFYNYYRTVQDLQAMEEASLFPPRFVIMVKKKSDHDTDLSTNIYITLHDDNKDKQSVPYRLYVPGLSPQTTTPTASSTSTTPMTPTLIAVDNNNDPVTPSSMVVNDKAKITSAAAKHSADTSSRKSFSTSVVYHNCIANQPKYIDLIKYSGKILTHWKLIAVSLNICDHKIAVIDLDHPYVKEKCYAMLHTWLQSTVNPCWCHFIQALYAVGLTSVAEEAKTHLQFIEGSGIASAAAKHSADTSGKSFSPSIGNHNCIDNKPNLRDLLKYSSKIAAEWERIALLLKIPFDRISVIKIDHPFVKDKCYAMFNAWLQSTKTPCWCRFIRALYDVKLVSVAEEVSKLHLQFIESSGIAEDFMQKYLKAKHDLGSVELKLLNILVFGPPGVGKSTLLSVLLCQNIQLLRESTGLLDRKLVQLKVAVQRDVAKCTSQWKVVNIDEEILRLRHTIQAKLENCTLENSNDLCSDLKPDMKIDEKFQTSVDSMIYEDQSSSITQQYTTSNTLIACYDSGGQPEFFDVMPAFISSTTGNVMVFDMSKDLDSNVDPDFFKNGQRWASSNRKTHYTGAQLLKTALANIQSYATDYPLCSAKSSHCGNSRLLVVGTHLDLCGDTEEEVHERLCQMEEKICADLLHDYSAPSIIKRCGERCTKTIFPIANKCDYKDCDEVIRDRKEVAQEIRTAIESMSENEKASKEIPISWLLFQYEIKLYSFPCISRSDCDEIAEKCYINKGDVDDVLRYFHELGIFLYYQDKDKRLSHVVFSDPQWLFAQLNKLIELKYNPSYDEKRSIKKGIFMKQFLTEIYGKEFNTELLHYEDIINLFVHLNIMARLSDATEQYFMPALLDPFSNDIPINTTFGNKIFSTLYVKFKDGFFPRGVFCCLIALCVKKNKSWKLQSNAAYKDLVVFQIENNEEFLILSDKIHYISLEIHCKEELKQNKHQVLSCVLYENLKEVCNTIHLDGEFKFGFLCKGKICEKFAHVQIQYPYYPENLLCSVCEYNPRMTYDQLIWFIPPKVLDVLTKSTSSMLSSCASTPTDQPCDHKMLLAQKAQMHELAEIISPRIMDKWERLAYSMRYEPGEVEALKKDSHDAKECCIKLFTNWLTTSHGPTPKTYQTLLNHIKQVKDLAAVSKAIENELMQQH